MYNFSNMQPEAQISSAQELQVGISEYLSSGAPVPAITKYLLTDFIVNEIAEDGTVVMLKERPDLQKCKTLVVHKQPEKISYDIAEEVYAEVATIFGKAAEDGIRELYGRLGSGEKVTEWEHDVYDMPAMNKEERMKVHTFVREKLVNIESNTLDGKMKLKLNKKMRKINPALRHKYLHFTLFKSNIDTMGALFRLSKLTGINQKLFSSAGLKDKRGVTTQLISVYNTERSQLEKFYLQASKNKEIWIADIKQGQEKDIGVGNLFGNQFGLVLRLINPADAEQIAARVQSLRERGMVNYFGMQRFGSCGVKTHMIGLKVVKRQWREAVEELLLEDTRDYGLNSLKEQCYAKEQYARAERQLPNKCKIEKNIFKGLKKYGKNFQNVFESLPRSIKTLYPHSLQSYFFNRMVTRRIREHGLELVEGDIVGRRLVGYELHKAQAEEQKLAENEQEEKIEEKIEGEQQLAELEVEEQLEDKYEVVTVTAQNKAQYSIDDVVMPLYGPMINLPTDSLAYGYLLEEFKEIGLTLEQFSQNSKKLCFKGMYRKMLVKPSNVSYKIISHGSIKQELQSPFYTIGEEPTIAPGPKKSVQVVLQLPKSSYATIALRELLHIPSSFEAQMALNKLYQDQKQQSPDSQPKGKEEEKPAQ